MEELSKSFKSILYERIKSPFYGAFIMSWIFWNWELLYFFFAYNGNFYEKVTYIKENYIEWNYNLKYPFFSAIAFYICGTLASIGFHWMKIQFSNLRKSKVERLELLTKEQSYKLKDSIQRREIELDIRLVDLTDKLKESEDLYKKVLTAKLENDKKLEDSILEKNHYEEEIKGLKEKNDVLRNVIESLTKELEVIKKLVNDEQNKEKEGNRLKKTQKQIDNKIYFKGNDKNEIVTYSSDFIDYNEGTVNIWALVTEEHNDVTNGNKYLYIISHDTNGGKSISRSGYQYENVFGILRQIVSNDPYTSSWQFWCNTDDKINNSRIVSKGWLEEGWHMFSVKWSRAENFQEFYIDSELKDSSEFNLWPVKNDGKINVGRWQSPNKSHKFNSQIGRFYAANFVLNQEELDELYNKGKRILANNNELNILNAKYGIEGFFIDVTKKIKDLIDSYTFEVRVSNDLVDGKDPVVGTVKYLQINYTENGVNKSASGVEGSTIVLK